MVGWAHDTEWTLARAVRRIRQQVIRCCHVTFGFVCIRLVHAGRMMFLFVWCEYFIRRHVGCFQNTSRKMKVIQKLNTTRK